VDAMKDQDEGDRLISQLWRELADEEAPPPGLETRLAARARGLGRTRRVGWLGWSTAGLAVAGLAFYVVSDSTGGRLDQAPAESPPAGRDEAPRSGTAALPEPSPEEDMEAAENAPSFGVPAGAESGAKSGPAQKMAKGKPRRRKVPKADAAPPAPARREHPNLEKKRVDSRSAADDEGAAGLRAPIAAPAPSAPSAGDAPRDRAEPPTAPNPQLVAALARMMAAPMAEQRAAWKRARRLVRNEVDRAEWMWAEVGLLQREGDPGLARERLRALTELGTPAQRARAQNALSD